MGQFTTAPGIRRYLSALLALGLLAAIPQSESPAHAADAPPTEQAVEPSVSARALFGKIERQWVDLIEPPAGAPARTFLAHLRLTRSDGLPKQVTGATADVSVQAPSQLILDACLDGKNYAVARDGQQLWVHEPGKKFALLGRSGLPLFKSGPELIDTTVLAPFSLPISRLQLGMATLMFDVEMLPAEKIADKACLAIQLRPKQSAVNLLHLPETSTVELVVHADDLLPASIRYSDGAAMHLQIDFDSARLVEPLAPEKWKLPAAADDKVQVVPVAHLMRFLHVAPAMLTSKAPTLGPATGEVRVVATEGAGRLEMIDGTRVLFLKGTPEEMGQQHGVLLKKEIHEVMDRILYGVGVASSLEKSVWAFGEIEDAEARLQKFIDPNYLREMDQIALAVGVPAQEARLANFFPEMFHCSGFSLMGKAVADGHVYQGRVLDYMRGVGLEQNAVVIVHQPNYGHAWVNISYCGFVGTVTAMNDQGISVGEMGGGGQGKWDGKPMAELLREVMEKSATLDDAVRIFKTSPRTCQYYYVVSDGKAHRAVGIAATPEKLETIDPGQFHAQLPHPLPDTVLMSAGSRYETLAKRVKDGFGHFDADSARELMTRPVCMTSNIQSVLFEPDTLDFWVANADAKNVASATRFTHYNLRDLLSEQAPPSASAVAK